MSYSSDWEVTDEFRDDTMEYFNDKIEDELIVLTLF